MSGAGAPQLSGVEIPADLTVAVVAAQWHAEIQESLLAHAVQTCRAAGLEPTVVRVPGTFELPVVAAKLATNHDAVVALGTVIRGGTPHFDYVCTAVTDGLNRVALDTGVPVGFGVLTCDDEAQARDRSGLPGSTENKGAEAAEAALVTAALLRQL